MQILIAPNAFKGSLTAVEAANCIRRGFEEVIKKTKNSSIEVVLIADGGDGTLDAIAKSTKCEKISINVSDPLGRKISAEYLIVSNFPSSIFQRAGLERAGLEPAPTIFQSTIDNVAIIELAQASGLKLLKPEEKNPLYTTTLGTGELIFDALEKGCRNFLIGIGGSATNDGGVGIAKALGYKFLDKFGQEIKNGGEALLKLAHINKKNIDNRLKKCKFIVASDVANPLLGKNGASAIYGPQKGANKEDAAILDKGLSNLANVIKKDLGIDNRNIPGSGAAGGAGSGLTAFLNAKLKPGFETIAEIINLKDKIAKTDLIVTGEGFMDSQSIQGKAPFGILKLSQRINFQRKVPVIAFCGGVSDDEDKFYEEGFAAVIPILPLPITLEKAVDRASEFLYRAALRTARIIF